MRQSVVRLLVVGCNIVFQIGVLGAYGVTVLAFRMLKRWMSGKKSVGGRQAVARSEEKR